MKTKSPNSVIPAKAGIHYKQLALCNVAMDTGFRRYDGVEWKNKLKTVLAV